MLVTEVWTQNPPLGTITVASAHLFFQLPVYLPVVCFQVSLSSAGSVRTECQGSVMMMMLDKSFVGKYFRINVIGE